MRIVPYWVPIRNRTGAKGSTSLCANRYTIGTMNPHGDNLTFYLITSITAHRGA